MYTFYVDIILWLLLAKGRGATQLGETPPTLLAVLARDIPDWLRNDPAASNRTEGERGVATSQKLSSNISRRVFVQASAAMAAAARAVLGISHAARGTDPQRGEPKPPYFETETRMQLIDGSYQIIPMEPVQIGNRR